MSIQTDRTLQLKTGAIAAATLAGIVVAGKGSKLENDGISNVSACQ